MISLFKSKKYFKILTVTFILVLIFTFSSCILISAEDLSSLDGYDNLPVSFFGSSILGAYDINNNKFSSSLGLTVLSESSVRCQNTFPGRTFARLCVPFSVSLTGQNDFVLRMFGYNCHITNGRIDVCLKSNNSVVRSYPGLSTVYNEYSSGNDYTAFVIRKFEIDSSTQFIAVWLDCTFDPEITNKINFYSFFSKSSFNDPANDVYSTPDTSIADDYHTEEQALIDSGAEGRSQMTSLLTNIGTVINSTSGLGKGMLVVSHLVGDLIGIPYISPIFYVSLALGMVAFILGMSYFAGKSTRERRRNIPNSNRKG